MTPVESVAASPDDAAAQAGRRLAMISTIARLLAGVRHIAVGVSSPIPAAGAMLLRARQPGLKISVLGSAADNFFTNGTAELFDCAAQGRVDAFFLSGGQIDGSGNVNLLGIGDPTRPRVRWGGCFGSSFLYYVVPKVILFRDEHSRRTLVPRVDFISAPGCSPEPIYRTGGPIALLTNLALFDFDRVRERFVLRAIHDGRTVEEIAERTGFDFDVSHDLARTPALDAATHRLLRGTVSEQLARTYPAFAARLADDLSRVPAD